MEANGSLLCPVSSVKRKNPPCVHREAITYTIYRLHGIILIKLGPGGSVSGTQRPGLTHAVTKGPATLQMPPYTDTGAKAGMWRHRQELL